MSAPHADRPPVLEVDELTVEFKVRGAGGRQTIRAVDGASFDVAPGETLGVVGESGSGKSTTVRAILGIEPVASGRIRYRDRDVTVARGDELRLLRKQIQMIFQNPGGSLNPRHRVGAAIREMLDVHAVGEAAERPAMVAELLERVGLRPALGSRYPHQLSGGQKQRVAIARALAIRPEILICDEAVSALDVSVQAHTVELLRSLQRDLGLGYLFISHDLAVVKYIAHRVAVMYLGRIVEIGDAREVLERPLHPYTRALLAAVPVPDVDVERSRPHVMLRGEVPSILNPPSGCRFRTRCPLAQPICAEQTPLLEGEPHKAACHFRGAPLEDQVEASRA